MTLVVDASALVWAGVGTDATARFLRARLVAEDCHAPYLIDAQLGNALRHQVRRREIPPSTAEVVLGEVPRLIDHRYAHTGHLADAAWALRENLTFYDALYVVLAGALNSPLLTLDQRLAGTAGLSCVVEVVGRGT